MRELMIARMREEIGDPNYNGRYGGFFYRPLIADPMTKRERKFNSRAVQEGRDNLDTLELLSDEELLNSYSTFMRRFSTWM